MLKECLRTNYGAQEKTQDYPNSGVSAVYEFLIILGILNEIF